MKMSLFLYWKQRRSTKKTFPEKSGILTMSIYVFYGTLYYISDKPDGGYTAKTFSDNLGMKD